jgi:hypothetical protein
MQQKHRIVSPLVDYFLANNFMRDPLEILGHRLKSVEVKFTQGNSPYSLANSKRFYFNPDNNLNGDNAIITAIEFVSQTEQTYLSDGVTLNATADEGSKWMLGIVDKDNDLLVYSPLSTFYAPIYIESGKQFTRKVMMTHFTTQEWMSCFIEAIDSSTMTYLKGFTLKIYYLPK